jgi:hypothetical protein
MFTVGHTVFIRPHFTPTEAGYAHEYIHTLQYLGTSQIGIVTRYGIEELFSGEFGSGSVGNRLERLPTCGKVGLKPTIRRESSPNPSFLGGLGSCRPLSSRRPDWCAGLLL